MRWNDADVVALGDIFWGGQYPDIHVEWADRWRARWLPSKPRCALECPDGRRSRARPGSNRAELAAYRDMLVAVGRKVREAVEQQGLGVEDILAAKPTAEFDARLDTPARWSRRMLSSAASTATWRRSAQAANARQK